ncbi:MAG: hypothetical protein MMC23_009741 [Stictis urceolatum]|nr:hypothetical protein [Stictis urceolata]
MLEGNARACAAPSPASSWRSGSGSDGGVAIGPISSQIAQDAVCGDGNWYDEEGAQAQGVFGVSRAEPDIMQDSPLQPHLEEAENYTVDRVDELSHVLLSLGQAVVFAGPESTLACRLKELANEASKNSTSIHGYSDDFNQTQQLGDNGLALNHSQYQNLGFAHQGRVQQQSNQTRHWPKQELRPTRGLAGAIWGFPKLDDDIEKHEGPDFRQHIDQRLFSASQVPQDPTASANGPDINDGSSRHVPEDLACMQHLIARIRGQRDARCESVRVPQVYGLGLDGTSSPVEHDEPANREASGTASKDSHDHSQESSYPGATTSKADTKSNPFYQAPCVEDGQSSRASGREVRPGKLPLYLVRSRLAHDHGRAQGGEVDSENSSSDGPEYTSQRTRSSSSGSQDSQQRPADLTRAQRKKRAFDKRRGWPLPPLRSPRVVESEASGLDQDGMRVEWRRILSNGKEVTHSVKLSVSSRRSEIHTSE